MKTKIYPLALFFCFVLSICLRSSGQSKDTTNTIASPRILSPVPYSTIKEYIENFNRRVPTDSKDPWQCKNKFAIPKEDVMKLLDGKDNEFLVAVLGRNGKLQVDISACDDKNVIKKNNQLNHQRFSIKKRNGYLVTKLRGGIPYKLDKFPLAIKLPKHEVLSLMEKTKCKYLLVYLGIEPKKNGFHKLDDESLTVCILGSSATSDSISRLHTDSDLPGGETWPGDSYTIFNYPQPTTDIKWE
jgi:hypothetical protein